MYNEDIIDKCKSLLIDLKFDSMKDEIDNKFNYSFLRIHSDKNVLLDRLESGFYYENMNTEE